MLIDVLQSQTVYLVECFVDCWYAEMLSCLVMNRFTEFSRSSGIDSGMQPKSSLMLLGCRYRIVFFKVLSLR